MSQQLAYATLGGGCFWCLEAVYQQAEGVHKATSGYAGGKAETANYSMVASGATNHAEVVQLQYDPEIISYAELLDIFWTIHDPTTLNRQGNDVGPQYRSVIFYHDEQQKAEAERSMQAAAPQIWQDPIVTELSPFDAFYPAEDSHQNYYQKVGNRNPYCTFIIGPKVQKFRKKFAEKVKS
jgi:peptide-methionine (S)-S-oxide reductase